MDVTALLPPSYLHAEDSHSLAPTAILNSYLYRLLFYFPGITTQFFLPDNLYQTNKASGRFIDGLTALDLATTGGKLLPFLSRSLKELKVIKSLKILSAMFNNASDTHDVCNVLSTATDSSGNIYMTGTIHDYLPHPYQNSSYPYYGGEDAVIAKYSKHRDKLSAQWSAQYMTKGEHYDTRYA